MMSLQSFSQKLTQGLTWIIFFPLVVFSTFLLFLITTTPGLHLFFSMLPYFSLGEIKIKNLHGNLVCFYFDELGYTQEKFSLRMKNTTVNWQLQDLVKNGTLVIKRLTSEEVTLFLPPQKQSLQSQFTLPQLPLNLAIHELAIKKIEISHPDNSHTQIRQFHTSIHFNPRQWEIKQLAFDLNRFHVNSSLQARATFPYPLTARIQLRYDDEKNPLKAFVEVGGDFSLYHWKGNMIREHSSNPSLTLDGILKKGEILSTHLFWQDLTWPLSQKEVVSSDGKAEVGGNLANLNLSLHSTFKAPLLRELTLAAQATPQAVTARGNLKLPDNQLNFNMDYIPGSLPHLKGFLNLVSPQHLEVASQFYCALPSLALANIFSGRQTFKGEWHFKTASLDFLKQFNSEIKTIGGVLTASLKGRGSFNQPILESTLSLQQAKLTAPTLGLALDNISFTAESNKKTWQAQGKIMSNKQTLILQGQGVFLPQFTGTIHVEGNDFPLIETSEYRIVISPQLALEFNPTQLAISGKITIPQAEIHPQEFKNSETVSEDVIFQGKSSPVLHLTTNIDLIMGEKVALHTKGLSGNLTGALHLQQEKGQSLSATGELNIIEGKYEAYGQELKIDQGQLFFGGPLITNPGIRVRAIRQINNPTTATLSNTEQLLDFSHNLQDFNYGNKRIVGIEITGRLNSPKLELFSRPNNLSQADILSLLLLGKPVNQANKAGGQLLLAAISSMKLNSGAHGTQLINQLKQTLGLDVSIENTSKYDNKTKQLSDGTSIVISKPLSKRLHASYNYGLAKTDSNVVTLTYLLNKFFSLQVNSSLTASGIDLLFTHQKE